MNDRPRTCYNAAGHHKQTFTTKQFAKERKRKWHDVYQCSTCGFWHLASKL